MNPMVTPESRWECSANIARSVSQPSGLIDPFESGQSGNAMPAPILVVNAPRVTSTKTQAAPLAANHARAGLYCALREEGGDADMSVRIEEKKRCRYRPQTL